MDTSKRLGMAGLCLAVALMAFAASGAGVFLRGDGQSAAGQSVRGESYRYAASGVYRWNAVRVVAEGLGWDVVTAFLAAPAAAVAALLVARGSYRGRLLALGLLAYFAYQFLEYATYWAFGPLLLLYIAIFATSLAGIAWIAPSLGAGDFDRRVNARFPRRSMAVFCLLMGGFLLVDWVSLILGALRGGVQGVLLGQTTLVVQAYDLGIVVPLLAFTGIALLRRKSVGYFLATALIAYAAAMSLAILVMLLSAWRIEGRPELPPLVIFALASAASLTLMVRMYRSVGETAPASAPA